MNKKRPATQSFPFLLAQIVVANVIVAAAVTATLYWIFTGLMGAYFENLTAEFAISPTKLNAMFATDVEQSLWWGIFVALGLGAALSLVLINTLLRPIAKMARATERIAAGDLSARAPAPKGELGTLAWHLNAMASALERQETERQQLLRDLSHELRTPLTNVKGYIEGLEDGVFEIGPDVLGVLNAEVRRLSDLIDDLTQLGISEELDGKLELEAVDLGRELASVISAHKGTMMENGFRVRVEHSGTPRPVAADRKRLHQILANGVANMVRYGQAEPFPKVNVRQGVIRLDWTGKDQVRICFENASAPIPEPELERLFDRFYRLDKSRAGRTSNVGLGLAIVKRLVSAHGGKVWLEQTGGRFRLFLSLALADRSLS